MSEPRRCRNHPDQPSFSAGLCRRCYNTDLAQRKAAGAKVTRGTTRTLARIECGHPDCTAQVPVTPARQAAYAAGRPLFCSREHRQVTVGAKVTVPCAVCADPVTRFRSDLERLAGASVYCGKPECRSARGRKPKTGNEKPCGTCGRPVYRRPSEDDGGPRYCSMACRAESLRGERVERPEVPCEGCGKVMRLEPGQVRLGVRTCSPECTAAVRRRKPGERYIDPRGYAWVTAPDGRNILEHRYVMERLVGRALFPTETVHHRTEGFKGRSNNDPANLELWTGRHPSGHRVVDVVAYCREMLAVYGDAAEVDRYSAHRAAVELDTGTPAAEDTEAATLPAAAS